MENQKNTNICILVNSLASGGAEKVVATIIPYYKKKNMNVFLLCLEKNDFFQIEDINPEYLSTRSDGYKSGFIRLLQLGVFSWRLKNFIKKHSIDLVQSHMYRSNYTNIIARILGSTHKIQIVNHGMPSQYLEQGLLGKINRFLVKLLYPNADLVICPSQGMVEELVTLNVPKKKLQLIANPIDLENIRTLGTELIFEPAFRFDPKKNYVIAIGRLEPVKRVMDILKAFAEIGKNNPSLELIILGMGSEYTKLTALSCEYGVQDQVHFLCRVKNPYNFLSKSQVFVSASAFEGFSNVIVEALAIGIPVIATDCICGPREILAPVTNHTKTLQSMQKVSYGILTPVADIQSLSFAINQLLNDKQLSKHYSIQGKIRSKNYDAATIAEQYFNSINQLLWNHNA